MPAYKQVWVDEHVAADLLLHTVKSRDRLPRVAVRAVDAHTCTHTSWGFDRVVRLRHIKVRHRCLEALPDLEQENRCS